MIQICRELGRLPSEWPSIPEADKALLLAEAEWREVAGGAR